MKVVKKIAILDDEIVLASVLREQFIRYGYEAVAFYNAKDFLKAWQADPSAFDAVVADMHLPESSGLEICRVIRAQSEAKYAPIILMSGSDMSQERTMSFEAGADEFISKPFAMIDLSRKLDALFKLGDRMEMQREQNAQLKIQIEHFQRQRKCTMAPGPQGLADPITSTPFSRCSRRFVTAVFVDLRQFTAFNEKAPPEAVMEVVNNYYGSVGRIAARHGGTVCSLVGDGIATIFHTTRGDRGLQEIALHFALDVRKELSEQKESWKLCGYELDFGVALADGYATIGTLGCEYMNQYVVIGSVMNLASRLCSLAQGGQVLASQGFWCRASCGDTQEVGIFDLKGVTIPVTVRNALGFPHSREEKDSA